MAGAQSRSGGSGSDLNINGVLLEKYLELIVSSTETFKDKDSEAYLLHAYNLKSMITDDDFYKRIDKAMAEKKREIADTHPGWSDDTKTFMECFCIVHECMKFLDHTLKITKRDVEINADQSDADMPEVAE